MKRLLFNALAGVSFALFLAIGGMWLRSYFVGDRWSWPGDANPRNWEGFALNGLYVINSGRGEIQFIVDSPSASRAFASVAAHDLTPGSYDGIEGRDPTASTVRWSILGFRKDEFRGLPALPVRISRYVAVAHPNWPAVVTRWTVPYWPFVVLSGIVPAWWALKWLMRRRYSRGLCQVCGYDLRATPDRCPECGIAI